MLFLRHKLELGLLVAIIIRAIHLDGSGVSVGLIGLLHHRIRSGK